MRKLILAVVGLFSVGIGGAVIAQHNGSIQNDYIFEGNLVRPGNIIRTLTLSNSNQDANTCRMACDADSNCNAYTYMQTAPNRKPVCHLRLIALPAGATRSHGYVKAISGTKLSFLPDIQKINPHPGKAMKAGTTLGQSKIPNEDPVACADICYRDGNCTGFTFQPRNPRAGQRSALCTTYSQNGQLTATRLPGVLSGTKGSDSAVTNPIINKRPRTSDNAKPSINPALRPKLSPKVRPVIERNPVLKTTPPDVAESDDDDAEQFPGEMLTPDER